MHQAAIKSLGLIGDELREKSVEKEGTHHEQTGNRRRKSQSPRTRRSSSPGRKITGHKGKMHVISSHKPG
jgi:hypothetical protein